MSPLHTLNFEPRGTGERPPTISRKDAKHVPSKAEGDAKGHLSRRAFGRRRQLGRAPEAVFSAPFHVPLNFRLASPQPLDLQLEFLFLLEKNLQIEGFLRSGLIVNRDRIASRSAVAGARKDID